MTGLLCKIQLTTAKPSYVQITEKKLFTAESSLKLHLISIRDRLAQGIVRALFWLDTRTMVADGLTKGGIDRKLLHELAGKCHYKCEYPGKKFTARKQKLGQNMGVSPASSGRETSRRAKTTTATPAPSYMVEPLLGLRCRC